MATDWDFRGQLHFGDIFHHIPSGVHVPLPAQYVVTQVPAMPSLDGLFDGDTPPTIELCNPMAVYRVPPRKSDEVPAHKGGLYLAGRPELVVVRRAALDDYATALVRIGKELQSVGYHNVVVPLRGGLKPWVQLDVITELKLNDCLLPFTQGANGIDKDQIRHHLKAFTDVRPAVSPYRLAVVDTANSGHSSNMLADIIKSIWSERADGSAWVADFYLLFAETIPRRSQPPKSREIEPKSTHGLTFRVYPHCVPDLIVEDWDAALGIKCLWRDGSKPGLEVVPSKGSMAVQEHDGRLHVIEADRLDRETDMLLGEAVSDAVRTEPGFHHTKDVWPAYLPKDGTPPNGPAAG